MPKKNTPIVIIGAGGIVNVAHLPAYKIAGFEVAGIYDVDIEKAQATALKHKVPLVFQTIQEAISFASNPVVFDLALPGDQIVPVLNQLPDYAYVLIQKPMGNHWEQAKEILELTRRKKMVAGVNFQLRYAPFVSMARKMINSGTIGEICDIDININVFTPWHLWPFLAGIPLMEVYYHSIHYVDLVRSFLGNPGGIQAQSKGHDFTPHLQQVRSNILMDYGPQVRVSIATNHQHHYQEAHQHAWIKIEGTKGAIRMVPGVLLDYPKGKPDTFEYILSNDDAPAWKNIALEGSWFPHAFAGPMAQLLLAAEGTISLPENSVEDAIFTMACLHAIGISVKSGTTSIPGI